MKRQSAILEKNFANQIPFYIAGMNRHAGRQLCLGVSEVKMRRVLVHDFKPWRFQQGGELTGIERRNANAHTATLTAATVVRFGCFSVGIGLPSLTSIRR